jgi:outer membrane protein assembly factor BamB
VDGQIVVVTDLGVDVYDATTGRPRWHYHEPGRKPRGYAETAGSLVVATNGPSEEDKDRWVGLEAKTGRIMWTSGERGLPLGSDEGLETAAGQGVVAVMPEGHDFGHEIRGIDARTGRDRWLWKVPGHDCDADPFIQHDNDTDSDESLLLVREICSGRSRASALDPATGKVRWARDVPDGATIIARHGYTLIGDAKGLVIVAADGRELVGARNGHVCGRCRFEVAGGHGVVTDLSADDRQPLLVDLRDGRVTPGPATGLAGQRYLTVTTAGGQMYALRRQVSRQNSFSSELLPAGLDVIDPAARTLVSRPLPFAFAATNSRLGLADVDWIAVAGGRLYTSRTVADTIRIAAYVISKPGNPAELGGVKQSDWPNACTVAPGYEPDDPQFSGFTTATIGTVSLRHVKCSYQMKDDASATLTIRWVAPTPDDAHRLLITEPKQPPQDRVDGADEAYLVSSASELWFRAGRYVVSLDEATPEADALASAAAKFLRTR